MLGHGLGLTRPGRPKGITYTYTDVIVDSFNRANNASSLGNADSGQAWSSTGAHTWGITNNQAMSNGDDAGTLDFAVIDSAKSDGRITSRFMAADSNQDGLCFRYSATNNYLAVRYAGSIWQLIKVVAGATTVLGFNLTVLNSGVFYVMQIDFVGPQISVTVDGVAVISASDAFNQTATRHGMRSLGFTLYDDFKFQSTP
jgi:hypothetical protein